MPKPRVSHVLERHLEKTPIQYIQWRFQDGHDRAFSIASQQRRPF